MKSELKIAAGTDIGRKRKNNEDSHLVLGGEEQDNCIVILADGMGGHRKGELASSTAVSYISEALVTKLKSGMDLGEIRSVLCDVVEKSNVKVFLKSLETPGAEGMGTTLLVGIIKGLNLILAHIGDCRCYVYRKNRLNQLTTDHTLVQVLVDRGDLSVESARRHKRKNVVTRALGSRDYVKADIIDYELMHGDILLFCSDGLHDYVEESDITGVLSSKLSESDMVNELIKLADIAGGNDNITAIIGRVL